jgi:hypothetical protein
MEIRGSELLPRSCTPPSQRLSRASVQLVQKLLISCDTVRSGGLVLRR